MTQVATPPQIRLGDTVEMSDPHGSWQGLVCVVDRATSRANVTTLDGQGASSVRLDSPDARVIASDPRVHGCSECQHVDFEMSMLCTRHGGDA